MAAIELANPRILVITQGKRSFRLTFQPIQRGSWMKYFENIISVSENQNGKRVDSFDSSGAKISLVEENLIDATGYQTPSGEAVTTLGGWQKMLPVSHRQAAGNILTNISPDEIDEDAPILLGASSVNLTAIWGIDETGEMKRYTGLMHRFTTPSAEDQRRYSRDSSRSRTSGGRNGTTHWLGAQATLAELYDKLILSVEGYQHNGTDLGSDRAKIIEHMDTYHKVAAAHELFTPLEQSLDEVM